MPVGKYKHHSNQGFQKGNKIGSINKGRKLSKEQIELMQKGREKYFQNPENKYKFYTNPERLGKISKALKGRKISIQTRKAVSKAKIGCIPWNKGLTKEIDERVRRYGEKHIGHKHNIKTIELLKEKNKNNKIIEWNRILKEVKELQNQGFRAIPIGKVIPDIIAIKEGKIFAVEVEYGNKPNYAKYTDEIRQFYDDIIWLLRKVKSNRVFEEIE